MKKNKYEIDMCNGTIMDKLISFSLPLMVSGILQLMFNAVDIIVVGRFSGSQALAAVGSTTALINVFINLFMGISLGANVLAARYYAAGRDREMSETVHTSIMLALISGVVMAFVGVFFAKGALELMDTPADVIDQSALYMRIYFMGMPFFMLYNYGAAILRAVGDTKRPLYFLIVSGVINAGLNMFLVIVFSLDVAGVAKLSAPVFEAVPEKGLHHPDFPGRHPGGYSEYRHQLLERAAAVIRQFLRFDCNGRLHGGQQCAGIFIHLSQLRHPGVHELHKPELRCRKIQTNG